MKRADHNKIQLIEKSINWWKEESFKTALEVEIVNALYEKGEINEKDVIKKLQELANKIDYLSRKGEFEQRSLFAVFAEK